MEHPDYRANLELVLEFTGGKKCLRKCDVRRFTGFTDDRTVERHFPILKQQAFISAATLARALCGEGKRL